MKKYLFVSKILIIVFGWFIYIAPTIAQTLGFKNGLKPGKYVILEKKKNCPAMIHILDNYNEGLEVFQYAESLSDVGNGLALISNDIYIPAKVKVNGPRSHYSIVTLDLNKFSKVSYVKLLFLIPIRMSKIEFHYLEAPILRNDGKMIRANMKIYKFPKTKVNCDYEFKNGK